MEDVNELAVQTGGMANVMIEKQGRAIYNSFLLDQAGGSAGTKIGTRQYLHT